MNTCYKKDEWLIIEEGFHPELNRESESIFSIGNGYMGQRANFEEHYSGDSLRGSYVAGVYYPDKTRVGWWKNGYPEFFAKVPNAPAWTGIDVSVNGNQVDLATAEIASFVRILNMKDGFLDRKFSIRVEGGRRLEFNSRRFVSMMEPDAGIIKYSIRSSDFDGTLGFSLSIDADVRNEDANYGKKFWKEVTRRADQGKGMIVARTMKTDFHVATGMCFQVFVNGKQIQVNAEVVSRTKYVASTFSIPVSQGDEVTVIKYAAVLSSLNNPKDTLVRDATKRLGEIMDEGYVKLIGDHMEV
ncbi:MAG: glycoside hydrolase family 65 protein, partial [Bacteroidales bacterium]